MGLLLISGVEFRISLEIIRNDVVFETKMTRKFVIQILTNVLDWWERAQALLCCGTWSFECAGSQTRGYEELLLRKVHNPSTDFLTILRRISPHTKFSRFEVLVDIFHLVMDRSMKDAQGSEVWVSALVLVYN